MNGGSLRVKFVALWSLLLLVKVVLAVRLPLLVDEAFYAWESRHPAWAYSDLPGLTAWLIGLGRWLGGEHAVAIRAPFLVLGMAVPWLAVRIASRWFGEVAGWRAGLLVLLMPLTGLLGVLALPDVPLVFSALLCIEGVARLRERVDVTGLAVLTVALALGAVSHYRFAAVILAGGVGVLCDARGRALLRDVRVWGVLGLGALAWLPLLLWNAAHAGVGLQFQLLDRNPWQFARAGWLWLPIQAAVVTPLVFAWLARAGLQLPAMRRREPGGPWGLLIGVTAVSILGYFLLGFFADHERVSFHWPLAGWVVMAIAAAGTEWPNARRWRIAGEATAALALVFVTGWLFAATLPGMRAKLVDTRLFPGDFGATTEIAALVRREAGPGVGIVADNFELAAKLVTALDRDDVRVLDHALNHKHGRSRQLELWHADWRTGEARSSGPILLVMEDTATPLKLRLRRYHDACAQVGPLPPPQSLLLDGDRRRYLIFRIAKPWPGGACVAPALAQIDMPAPGETVGPAYVDVMGWAFKDGVGVRQVEVALDDKVRTPAIYGDPMPHVARQWQISTDPAHPQVGFHARVPLDGVAPGRHHVRAIVHGNDGSVEWSPAIEIVRR